MLLCWRCLLRRDECDALRVGVGMMRLYIMLVDGDEDGRDKRAGGLLLQGEQG